MSTECLTLYQVTKLLAWSKLEAEEKVAQTAESVPDKVENNGKSRK